jgi:hypothetical protein
LQSVIGAARLKVEDIKIKGDIYRPQTVEKALDESLGL